MTPEIIHLEPTYGISPYVRQNANKYDIPDEVVDHVIARDEYCVYCRRRFLLDPRSQNMDGATWEHLDGWSVKHPEVWNITLCCGSCNSSRGPKSLPDWFTSGYCRERNITRETVAPVIERYLATGLRGHSGIDPAIHAQVGEVLRKREEIEALARRGSAHP